AAAKRGGGAPAVPLPESNDTSTSVEIPDPSSVVSDAFFDRQWALNLIERALRALAAESQAEGKGAFFDVLKPWLVGDTGAPGEAAQKLGLTEGAAKVAIHRFRKRFRAMIKAEISETVSDPAEVQVELRYLVEVLSQT
ncbi:MAG TPA: sigma-70 family RNA polymerase sigma factor, partial [Verrucomicrobiae bacterium]|nr:sigma-70 family RNA polymerase sigma factor [Verrucomicrobiae bacterium]